ncbi:MAG TPA: transcriptional repressor [Candidatus Avisuccinivibrio pullicola]|nr:transcriptional repressor [Candidatus Avisuccinivibrio pullicola]
MQNEDEYYEVGSLTEETLRKLEESGLRMTVQRRHIIDILTRSDCTSPKEVWYEAREFVPDLGIATVYRLINRLEQIGVLSKQRNLGMRPETPELGTIKSGRGQKTLDARGTNLQELLRLGLISRGIIGHNNVIQLSLVGNKVNVTVVR